MTWIEGVGDEVTVFFGIVIIVLVISLAWLSTGIRDIPLIGVIIIELTTRRQRVSQVNNQGTPIVQTSDDSTPETDSSTGDIFQTEDVSTEQEGHQVQGHVVQEDQEEQGLQEERTEGQDNKNLKEVQKGQSDSGESGNKEIGHSEDVVEDFTEAKEAFKTKAESQENKEKMLKTELSDTDLRHRRMTFFEKATKLDNESMDLSFRDNIPVNNSQTTDNVSLLEKKTILDTDFDDNTCSECHMNLAHSGNGEKSGIPNSVVVSNVNRPATKTEELRQESERVAEELSNTSQSENVTTQPDGFTEENTINSDSTMIRIRLKYFNDSQRLVSANPTDTVENFRRTHFSVELSENKLIRFIFNGQELRINSSTLEAYNIVDNSVIHCLISQDPSQTAAVHTSDDESGFDMGVVMFPLFGLLLAIIWYFRFTYRQFFNVTSTLSLAGITFLFLAALCASFRRRHGHEHLE
ncbi:hypothetical protein ACJMK2_021305 [Sinanodonta woodiana]